MKIKVFSILLVSITSVLLSNCVSKGMIVSALNKGGAPKFVLLHSNPKVGDYAVYLTRGEKSKLEIVSVTKDGLFEISQGIGDYGLELRLFVRPNGEVRRAEAFDLETSERHDVRINTTGDGTIEKIREVPLKAPTKIETPAGSFVVKEARVMEYSPAAGYKTRSVSLIHPDIPFLSLKTRVVSQELSAAELNEIDPSRGNDFGLGNLSSTFDLIEMGRKNN